MKIILTTILLGFPLIANAQWRMPETIILHQDIGAPDNAILEPYKIDSDGMDILEIVQGEWGTMFTPVRLRSDGTICRDLPLLVFEFVGRWTLRDIDGDGKDDLTVKITTDMSRPISTRVFYSDGWLYCR